MVLGKGTPKASKFEQKDFISNLPENVVANIMDRLPLQYAVRTSMLSRKWRSKWTLLTQLVCDQNFYDYLTKKKEDMSLLRIVVVLLHYLKGRITKFVLSCYNIYNRDIVECVLCWLKKGIKDLTIKNARSFRYTYDKIPDIKLPIHLYSCLELEHLKLENCCFNPLTTFHGFPKLLSLELSQVLFASGKFWELCPALEMLRMTFPFDHTSKVKPAEIGKLVNLKKLSLFMCNLDNAGSSSIFELVGFLPKLQELNLDLINCNLKEDGAINSRPTTFLSIKTLKLSTIDFGNGAMLAFASKMINSFPNLQNLEIKASYQQEATVGTPGTCFSEGDYTTTGIRSLVFRDLKGADNEVSLITHLVMCSPFLKKVVIHPHSHLAPGEQLTFAGKLLKLQRAYPVVDINL